MAKPGKHNANNLSEYLNEMALDEETVLSNLAFEPVIIGRQLLENHFGVNDFHGVEANRILLAAMLRLIEEEETLNLANLMYILDDKEINEKKSKLDKVGGEDRISGLFLNPFLKPGVKMFDDIEPVIKRIRDRNVRMTAHKAMVQYAERIMVDDKDSFETLGNCIQSLRSIFLEGSTGYMKTLESHIDEMQEMVNLRRIKRQSYLGLETNFPILMEKLNGFQKEFYLITGGVGMGKSTFATQLAWDLTVLNPELTVLYFSLDLNRLDVTAKIVSQAAELPIDYVKNPYSERPDLEELRQKGLNVVGSKSDRLMIIDESTGRLFIDDIKKHVRRTRLERGGEVAVVIDPLFKILLRNQHNFGFNEKCNIIASELKSLAAVEGVSVIATAGLPKAISNRRPVKEDLEEIMGLLYDPYAIFFLYCDYLNNFDTPFLEWEWGKEDSFMIPITEALIAKNKMGSVNSRIFYRYFEAYSKFKECAPQEVENYTAMIDNLEKFKENQNSQKNKSCTLKRQEEF
ncbi:MAG: DnaB-like helicase C-terminal domain-containing protein [Candidatus Riflebacteria bacterium]